MARNILSWKGTDIAVQRAIRRYPRERLIPVVESVLRRESLRMETHAKQNAPWTDRTGAARRGLTGSVETRDTVISALVAYSPLTPYGAFLELGKYGILGATIRWAMPNIRSSLTKAFK